MGGSGKVRAVVERVGQIMKGALSRVDYEPLNSDPDTLRWENAVKWARNEMVKDGLLKDDSPRGTWELAEAGRRALKG
jgi:restriction system protein